VDEAIEKAVVEIAIENPALGQLRVSNELKKKGLSISPGGVRSIWLRHDLHNFKLRLKALESISAQEGIVLTESQLSALERAKEEKKAHGEIETHHPGYLGAQDTYYVGNIKGVGHIYQQTFIDTYSKVAFAKLYDRKNALIAADMLNDQVVPFFEQQDLRLLRILTDRGTEYCGIRDRHEYQLYLAIEDIDHTKTKAKSPQTNGICERFHRTIQDEFYAIAFRKKIYRSIEEQIKEMYDFDVSTSTISRITNAVASEVIAWQNRPLEDLYLIVWMDGIVFKVRENSKVINKTIYLAVGLNREGRKEVLGMWLGKNESSSFWMSVLTDLKARGVEDILITAT